MSEPAVFTETSTELPATLELRVLEGPQRGARTPLPAGRVWCVQAGPLASHGSAEAEVALLSSSAARVQVRHVREQITLRLLDGAAELGSQQLTTHADVAWHPAELLRLGESALAYGPTHQAQWAAPQVDVSAPSPKTPHAPAEPRNETAEPTRRWHLVLAGAGVVLVASSVALGVLAQLIPAHAVTTAMPPSTQAKQASTSAELEAAVADVFRLHGIQARVARTATGSAIEVHTAEVDAARLARAEAAVRRDLPAAPVLKVVNRAPARVAAKPALEDDPGKRITGVVADEELPYLVTADGSRYFQGAWLPSGHRVVSIADRRVTVELDGVATELSL